MRETHARLKTLGMLGILDMESLIEQRKLAFFGMLCRLESNSSTKFLFLYRLTSFVTLDCQEQQGFISDIIKIARKHNLYKYIIDYVNGIDFPTKSEWKRITKIAIRDKFNLEWISRVKNDQQLTRTYHVRNIDKEIDEKEIMEQLKTGTVNVTKVIMSDTGKMERNLREFMLTKTTNSKLRIRFFGLTQ